MPAGGGWKAEEVETQRTQRARREREREINEGKKAGREGLSRDMEIRIGGRKCFVVSGSDVGFLESST